MGLRDKAHLRRALAGGTATDAQMREAVAAIWDALETLETHIAVTRRNITVTGDDITLTTGNATIELDKDGTITIRGSGKINIKGSSDVQIAGRKITQN